MNATRRSFWSVVFFNQYNLALLGAAAAYALALRSGWPLIVFAALELVWLFAALVSGGVRRWAARYVLNQERLVRTGEAGPVVRELEPAYAERVDRLEKVAADVRRMVWERGLEEALVQGGENRLEATLLAFVKMVALHQRLSRFATQANPAQVEEEILGLGQSLATESNPSVRYVLSHALAIAQGRLEQQESLQGQLRVLGVKIGTLEMSLDYLRSRIFGGSSDRELAAEVAQLMGSLALLSDADAHAIPSGLPGQATPPQPVTRVTTTHAVEGS